MQTTDSITVHLGEAQVRVPAMAAAMAYLDTVHTPRITNIEINTPRHSGRPAIGDPYLGGDIYAGLTIHDNTPMALVLLPPRAEDLTWKKALEWAKEQKGELPTRIDALVMFKNLRAKFEKAWYWTSEQDEFDDDYAWVQDFDDGNQGSYRKSIEYRAFLVRRFPI